MVFACSWFNSCPSQRSKAAWLSSVWVQAHADFVNQLPTSSVLSWDHEKEVSGVPEKENSGDSEEPRAVCLVVGVLQQGFP